MKNALLLIIVFFPAFLFSQGIYLKASGNYHIPITTQDLNGLLPDNGPSPSQQPNFQINYNLNIPDLSLAKGISLSGAIGYTLNELICLQMDISYFFNTKKEFESFYPNTETKMSYNSFKNKYWALTPSILIGKQFNKSRVDFKPFFGINLNSLNVENSGLGGYYIYEFDSKIGITCGVSFEFSYEFIHQLSLFLNAGLSLSSFTPQSAKLIGGDWDLESYTLSEREFIYVEGAQSSTNLNEPTQMEEVTINSNSVYFGLGLKYYLGN